ncbi:glycosyltransferase family 4 protein [Selenomonas sp. TAMA-11512]|uniref:glycosyltransferase family 4 protein n=1 Tax=Selenomonas sp. TAMA-11512 TaxID=3095337 RepID=UPI003087D9AD|nr:glycosyltransferase family 4 protein [Selenomonas sp. TAMA-11512]
MKVLYIITQAQLGGAQTHVHTILKNAPQYGIEPVLAVGKEGWLTDEAQKLRIPVHLLPDLVREISPGKDKKALREIDALLREEKPELVHCHSSKAGILGRLAACRLGIPAVFTAHGWAFTEGVSPVKRRLYQGIEALAGYWAKKIICVSDYDKRLAERCLSMHRHKLVTVHNGIEMTEGAGDSPQGARTDDSSRLHFVMVARFSPPKRQDLIVRALRELRAQGYGDALRVDFVGDGELLEGVRRLAKELEVEDDVSFLGNRTDVDALLPAYDAFLLISDFEGFPISILEAMRTGLPVIASDVGGVKEEVIDGETGRLVPRGDAAGLASVLRTCVSDRKVLHFQGKRGYEYAVSRFAAEEMMEKIVCVYSDAMHEPAESR